MSFVLLKIKERNKVDSNKKEYKRMISFKEPSIYDEYDRDKEIQRLNSKIKTLLKYIKKVFLAIPKSQEVCPQCRQQSLEPTLKQCNNQGCQYQTKKKIKYKNYNEWVEE